MDEEKDSPLYIAGHHLACSLRHHLWFSTVSIESPENCGELVVYTNKRVNNEATQRLKLNGWRGYKVLIKNIGKSRPA